MPISAQTGRRAATSSTGAISLPPLNFTPGEAAAIAVALSRSDSVPWADDARNALRKVVAAMPAVAAHRAREVADGVRLLMQPTPEPDPVVAGEVWRGVHEGRRLLLEYVDIGNELTVREVEPHHVRPRAQRAVPHRLVHPARRGAGVPDGPHPGGPARTRRTTAASRPRARRPRPRHPRSRVGLTATSCEVVRKLRHRVVVGRLHRGGDPADRAGLSEGADDDATPVQHPGLVRGGLR